MFYDSVPTAWISVHYINVTCCVNMWCYTMIERIAFYWIIRIVSTNSNIYFEIQITSIVPSIDTCMYPNKCVLLDVCQKQMTVPEIWKSTCPPDEAVILTVDLHDQLSGNCSHSTDFHASSQDSASCQSFSHFVDITCPSQTRLILQYQTTYYLITSKARYKKHVHANINTSNSEFWSIFKGSVNKNYNVLWHISVATAGVYWWLLCSTITCHIQRQNVILIAMDATWNLCSP
jgi:hypothetical protein